MNQNNTNFNSSYVQPPNQIIAVLDSISNIFGYYFIPILSGAGFLLNTISLIILSSSTLKPQIYRYLRCKTIYDIIFSLIGIGFQNSVCLNCPDKVINTRLALIYTNFGIFIPIRVFLLCKRCMDICLTIKKLVNFQQVIF